MLFQLGAGLFIKNVLSARILMVVLRKIHLKKNQSASSDATNIFIDYLWLTMTFSVFGKTITHQILVIFRQTEALQDWSNFLYHS